MNFKAFTYGFFAVFGFFSVSTLLESYDKSLKNSIASYWNNVGSIFKKVFDEQTQKL